VLFEGVQNAEDAGASKFVFMLDLRRHSTQGLDPDLHRFAGPAFVVADDGSGFEKHDWTSLQNLHASVKQDSPSEIGSFGMGTRSYFHYTDVVFVASKNIFVGLDPLEIVSHEGGWMLDTSIKSEADDARRKGVDFCNVPNLDFPEKGSIFRLPLRLKEPVAGSFGTEVTEAKAREMLDDFAKQLASGEMLLFLSNVTCIELWLWEHDAVEPKLVEQVHKTFVKTSESWGGRRLPYWVSDDSRKCYKALAAQLLEMDDNSRDHYFSLVSQAVVETKEFSSGQTRRWFIAQRFDTRVDLAALISSCRTVPIVGVAGIFIYMYICI